MVCLGFRFEVFKRLIVLFRFPATSSCMTVHATVYYTRFKFLFYNHFCLLLSECGPVHATGSHD